ncbi:MAG: hypothetical protein IJR21_01565, partial [Synergistaceae bacterium]|nr:hypothetical protein [Synergistaceae bacterium]
MRNSKLGRAILAAVLALMLGASGAMAAAIAQKPTPIEDDGTLTLKVSFDADGVTAAKTTDTKKYEAYAPEFKSLKAYTNGINFGEEAVDLQTAADGMGLIESGHAATDSAIGSLAYTLWHAAATAEDDAVKL